MAILPNLTAENEALKAQLAALSAQLAIANTPRKLSLKVSEKGAVSLYGMGRFPVTLYGTQWERLIEAAPQIKAFLVTNASLLATKPTA